MRRPRTKKSSQFGAGGRGATGMPLQFYNPNAVGCHLMPTSTTTYQTGAGKKLTKSLAKKICHIYTRRRLRELGDNLPHISSKNEFDKRVQVTCQDVMEQMSPPWTDETIRNAVDDYIENVLFQFNSTMV
mgnify:CR=1 FL=1